MKTSVSKLGSALALAFILPRAALAEIDSGDTAWILASGDFAARSRSFTYSFLTWHQAFA